jgi:RNA polymerase sigma-70 factor (ECF subfamily)
LLNPRRAEKSPATTFSRAFAACDCTAKDYESTDWIQILRFYDQLVKFDHSPVVALNRAIVVANIHGPTAGLAATEEIPARDKLNSYYLLHAVLGDLNARLDQSEAAAEHFRKSLNLAETRSERTFLTKRIYDCASQASLP